MIRALVTFALVTIAACSGTSKVAPSASPTAPTPPADASGPPSCEDACTDYAACWEEVNGGDFSRGGECVSACEELDEQARASYLTCVTSGDCEQVVGC